MNIRSIQNIRFLCMADMYSLDDKEIYAIVDSDLRYAECIYCLCRMCINMPDVCRMCFMCEFRCAQFKGCRFFVPFVFGSEPYKSYFRELEKIRNAPYDYLSRFE